MNVSRLRSLLLGEYTYRSLLDTQITVETLGAYGEAVSALDRGNCVSVLDVIAAEQGFESIRLEDEAAWAAAILAMCGAKPEQLGGLFHPKLGRGRPGKKLLDDAATMVAARMRQEQYAIDRRRRELRS